jgi:hypothetical protein
MFEPTQRRLATWSAVLNLIGAFLVFLSFQATSSEFALTMLKDGRRALCSNNDALIMWGPGTVGMGLTNGCSPDRVLGIPRLAIVTIDSPALGYLGWFVLLLGFFIQVFSSGPSLLTNEQIRNLRKAEKILNQRK